MAAQFCQCYAWSGTSTGAAAETSKTWKFTLPKSVGAGNRLVLAVAYSDTTAPTITDNNGNTWPASAATATNVGGVDLSVWDLKNANAGVTIITVTFGAAQQPVWGECQEWSGLSTSAGNGGTITAVVQSGASLSAGSFTPTNNNANGGNLILCFAYDANPTGDVGPTSWTAGTSFTLVQGQITMAFASKNGLPCASEYFVQATSAAINPGISDNGDASGTQYNLVAIALPLSPGAGTPPPSTMYIAKSLKSNAATVGGVGATTLKGQFPTVGNLRVLMASSPAAAAFSSITDSDGTYTLQSITNNTALVAFLKNQSADPTNIVTFNVLTGFSGNSVNIWYVDIANAATGTVVGVTASTGDVGGQGPGNVSPFPSITPQASNSIITVVAVDGNGPTLGPLAPAGAIGNNVGLDAAAESDAGIENSGDAFGYIYNTSTSAQSWTWNIAGGLSTTFEGTGIEWLAAPTVTGGGTLTMMGVG